MMPCFTIQSATALARFLVISRLSSAFPLVLNLRLSAMTGRLIPMFSSLSSVSLRVVDYDTTEPPFIECDSRVNRQLPAKREKDGEGFLW